MQRCSRRRDHSTCKRWDRVAVSSIDNGLTYQSSILFDSLLAGTYYVIVNDQNNCLASAVVVIAQPDPLLIAATLSDETCSANNGNINLIAVGGTGPWVYSIDSGMVYSAQANHNAMNAGIYNLSVRDANGCKTYQQVALVDLASPQITNYLSANVNCYNGNDGSISLVTTGGSGTLLYSLNYDPPQTGMLFSNLTTGNYILSVADTNACIDTIHVVISQPPLLLASATSVNPLCFGSADGTASVVAAGGISGYSYMWSNGNTATAISGLGDGTYSKSNHQHACVTTDSVVLVQPNAIVITHTTTNAAACAGAANGTASVTVIGGTGPYAYAWSPVSSNTWYAANLGAGLYNVAVTDAHGCIENHQITITDPAPVTAQFIIADVNCFGGSDGGITVVASGGSGLYSYAWDQTLQTDSALFGLPVGNYAVVVTDNSGCIAQATAVVSSPPQISVLGIVSNTLCYGDSNGVITLSTAGGVSPYSYSWSNGSTMSTLASLPSGNYTVDITYAHGCLRQASYSVVDPPEILIAAEHLWIPFV